MEREFKKFEGERKKMTKENHDIKNVFKVKKGDLRHSTEVKVIKQSILSSECWLIQMSGLKACERCEYKNKKECGGKEIRQRLLSGR